MSSSQPPSMIEHISTCWPMIRNPVQFVMRYAPAIRKYVGALVRNAHEADDVAQEFLTRVVDKGFHPDGAVHGRFRDYLKAAIRYVAISHLRRRQPEQVNDEQLASLAQAEGPEDCAWADEWRACVLERAWQALELHEQKTAGNLFHTVLRAYTSDPDTTSDKHAQRLSQKLGRNVSAANFRQQLHRARGHFARLVVDELKQTLQAPTEEAIEQELIDLKLLAYVQGWLSR